MIVRSGRLRAFVLLAAVAGGAVATIAACSGSGGAAAAGASPVATNTVDLPRSYKFAPAAITVPVGTTVRWTNDDNFTHSVQLDGVSGQGLVMKPRESVSQPFTTAGTFHYVCAFHPQNMQGTVAVTGSSY